MTDTQHTPGPWEYVQSTEHHGPYVVHKFGPTVCDCYTMTQPGELSVRNGGASKPVHFMADEADANARLIAAAPDLLEACQTLATLLDTDDWIATGRLAVKQAQAAIAKVRGEEADQ